MTSTSKLSPLISGTRRLIIELLLKTDANAVTLAEQLSINISAVRGHLDVLEIAGLVSSRHEHATRGRPKRIYTLTQLAYNLFPDRTHQVISALVEVIVRSFDAKTTTTLIRQVVTRLWQVILPDKPTGSLQDRLATIVQALDNFGFYASFETIENQYAIVIQNDVFRSALITLPNAEATRFQQEFWKRLNRIVGGVQVQIIELTDSGQHGFRVVLEERRE